MIRQSEFKELLPFPSSWPRWVAHLIEIDSNYHFRSIGVTPVEKAGSNGQKRVGVDRSTFKKRYPKEWYSVWSTGCKTYWRCMWPFLARGDVPLLFLLLLGHFELCCYCYATSSSREYVVQLAVLRVAWSTSSGLISKIVADTIVCSAKNAYGTKDEE